MFLTNGNLQVFSLHGVMHISLNTCYSTGAAILAFAVKSVKVFQ